MARNLVFCGQSISPGLNYSRCPLANDCPREVQVSFWRAASSKFAQLSLGTVYVLLNGSSGTAFNPNSIFAQFELPNLPTKKVETVFVLLLHDVNKPKKESCGTGSLEALQTQVRGHGFKYGCLDDPVAIQDLLCVDSPMSALCKRSLSRLQSSGAGHIQDRRSRTAGLICVFITFVLLQWTQSVHV